jgi:hypothetical protein
VTSPCSSSSLTLLANVGIDSSGPRRRRHPEDIPLAKRPSGTPCRSSRCGETPIRVHVWFVHHSSDPVHLRFASGIHGSQNTTMIGQPLLLSSNTCGTVEMLPAERIAGPPQIPSLPPSMMLNWLEHFLGLVSAVPVCSISTNQISAASNSAFCPTRLTRKRVILLVSKLLELSRQGTSVVYLNVHENYWLFLTTKSVHFRRSSEHHVLILAVPLQYLCYSPGTINQYPLLLQCPLWSQTSRTRLVANA